MFTIQYEAVNGEHKTQTFDSGQRAKLVFYLTTFGRPIMAVYEQSTPITKAIQIMLSRWPGSMSRCARDFAANAPVTSQE